MKALDLTIAGWLFFPFLTLRGQPAPRPSLVLCPLSSPTPLSSLQPVNWLLWTVYCEPTMHLTRLTLTNFRNYPSQTLDLAPGPILLLGPNAQGKTNILEAIFLLATGRSERATTDADLIAWSSIESDDPQPIARISLG